MGSLLFWGLQINLGPLLLAPGAPSHSLPSLFPSTLRLNSHFLKAALTPLSSKPFHTLVWSSFLELFPLLLQLPCMPRAGAGEGDGEPLPHTSSPEPTPVGTVLALCQSQGQ